MQRYNILFKQLKKKKEGCLVPFIVIGDPCFNTSLDIIDTLIIHGANALELGFPFSDPLADGPTIQKANLRSFSQNININKCFSFIKKIRKKYIDIPIGVLTYANIILGQEINYFFYQCAQSEIDSVLIADVPIEESKKFYYYAKKNGIDIIFVCPPNADDLTIKKICNQSSSFIYLLSRSGVTGTKNKAPIPIQNIVDACQLLTNTPLLQGFGISDVIQIKKALQTGINGVICGSVIIEIIEKNIHNHYVMMKNIKNLICSFKSATLINQ
ncbi:tryptophan synthase subunit alpha [Buchnera aphidicola (Thelaxes californica)]|uniref:Tryptophan synthase alpha chain n=1 Tax=Buchnera aphidicola (Thelaxes californica) TaxID=1315998 RepID=A0A4D6YM19_9GAMM|nr:tryptophan synthase subunit alpha [Buchnera aphidicola]QCI26748.1 tryptophan synthase subunit alpha [Buchnera aphidicola (Thelaxes californica)]